MQAEAVGAVIMAGPHGTTPQEQVVGRALRASALDLVEVLTGAGFGPVVVAGPDLDWLPEHAGVIRDVDAAHFHFGERLAGLIAAYDLARVVYFGAGSAPLLSRSAIGTIRAGLLGPADERGPAFPRRVALTNNLHSSDWIGMDHAREALPVIRQAARDNSLAWLLQQSGAFDVRVLADIRPAAGIDLDTPADLGVVRVHPDCPPNLARALTDPLLDRIPVEPIVAVAARDGGRLAVIGRVSPLAWHALSSASQCWIRVFSEERGMVASERFDRGEVRSLVGRMLALLGPSGFFRELGQIVDAAIIDSRVLMAASGHYPGNADRFASDLFLADAIADPWVRAFTEAAAEAPIPVLLGGHGVVAGGLHALADIVAARRRAGQRTDQES
jgi:hypothetical protein